MKPCHCGAYGPGSTHTWACREGKRIIRQIHVRDSYQQFFQQVLIRKDTAA